MGNVAITGAGGYIGQRLISYLDSQGGCTRILGTDIDKPEVASEKLTFLNRPNMQFVHEDDVAQLFSLLIEKKVSGAFNVAGDGVIRSSEVGAMIGKRAVKVPRWLYHAALWTLWNLRLKSAEAPPGIVDYTSYPWVVDTTKAKERLGWKPKYTSKDTLRIMFRTHGYPVVD